MERPVGETYGVRHHSLVARPVECEGARYASHLDLEAFERLMIPGIGYYYTRQEPGRKAKGSVILHAHASIEFETDLFS